MNSHWHPCVKHFLCSDKSTSHHSRPHTSKCSNTFMLSIEQKELEPSTDVEGRSLGLTPSSYPPPSVHSRYRHNDTMLCTRTTQMIPIMARPVWRSAVEATPWIVYHKHRSADCERGRELWGGGERWGCKSHLIWFKDFKMLYRKTCTWNIIMCTIK